MIVKDENGRTSAGEQIGGAHELAGEVGRGGADGQNALLDAGGEEFLNGTLAHGEALGLDEGAGGDLVELILEVRHLSPVSMVGGG